jgi:hypothetical protein
MTAFLGPAECRINYSGTGNMVVRSDYVRRWNRGVLTSTGTKQLKYGKRVANRSPQVVLLSNRSPSRQERPISRCWIARRLGILRSWVCRNGVALVEQLCGLTFVYNDTIRRIICSSNAAMVVSFTVANLARSKAGRQKIYDNFNY